MKYQYSRPDGFWHEDLFSYISLCRMKWPLEWCQVWQKSHYLYDFGRTLFHDTTNKTFKLRIFRTLFLTTSEYNTNQIIKNVWHILMFLSHLWGQLIFPLWTMDMTATQTRVCQVISNTNVSKAHAVDRRMEGRITGQLRYWGQKLFCLYRDM